MTDRHLDVDDLAAKALDGEPLVPDERRHLLACATCREEHDAVVEVVATARRMAGEPRVLTRAEPTGGPSPGTWGRIVERLDHGPAVAAALQGDIASPDGAGAPVPPPEEALPHDAGRGWRSLAGLSLAASVAVVALVAAAVGLLDRRDPGATQIALESLEGGETATATLREDPDGRWLDVRLPGVVTESGSFYEVWLIDADVDGMVSLGVASGDMSTLRIPEGLDMAAFPILDVSVEPLDGDPTHSGDSRWRGTVAT